MSNEGQRDFEYPFPQDTGRNIWQIPLPVNVSNRIKSIFPRSYQRKRNPDIRIWPINELEIPPLSSKDMPAIFLVHNDMKMLPSFLKHYRDMGVTRFICIDDQSDDGSREYLAAQDDVDVFQSNVRYSVAHRGKAWREMLVTIYGKNRWYLNLDSDEYLFTGQENRMNLLELAKKLEANGIYRLPAPMIDMVPAGDLNKAVFDGIDGTMPWEVATHFDCTGYHGKILSSGISIRGGARKRLFGAIADLMKYPFIYWDDKTSMGASIHAPKPGFKNFAPVCGCMLHLKIFSDAQEVAQNAIDDQQYFSGSREYKRMYEFLSEHENSNMLYEHSIEFCSVEDLIRTGFIKSEF